MMNRRHFIWIIGVSGCTITIADHTKDEEHIMAEGKIIMKTTVAYEVRDKNGNVKIKSKEVIADPNKHRGREDK